MKYKILLILTVIFFCISALTAEPAENDIISDMPEANFETDKIVAIPNGPLYIKNLSRKMKSPGYWISKIKEPDKVIFTKEQIEKRNNEMLARKFWVTDILKYPKIIRKNSFQKQLNIAFGYAKKETFLDSSLKEIPEETLYKLKENAKCRITTKSLKTSYAITINYTDIRMLPTKESFISSKETFDIDRLQVAGLDIGEPLVVIAKSKDKKWTYVVSVNSEGWVQSKDIISATPEQITDWQNPKAFIVVTETKSDIYLDDNCTNFYDYARMGATFPLINIKNSMFCVKIPRINKKGQLYFSKAYISKANAHKGYLPYTQRNVLNIAFKHLNSPYAWGGMEGEQDCSTFIRQIFSCFGMLFPRNSSTQIKCGNHPEVIKSDDSIETRKSKIINNAKEGLSLLFLPGHIMLYIGQENNSPYAIHALWGTETIKDNKEKAVSYINRILVSDLNIGTGNSRGALIERMTDFNVLD